MMALDERVAGRFRCVETASGVCRIQERHPRAAFAGPTPTVAEAARREPMSAGMFTLVVLAVAATAAGGTLLLLP